MKRTSATSCSTKPAASSCSAIIPSGRPGELARLTGGDRLDQPAAHHLAGGDRAPRVLLRAPPRRQGEPPSGLEHPARLPQRGLGVGHQHVAPAAQDAVDARGLDVDRALRVDLLEADVAEPELLRAALGDHQHLGRDVRRDQRAAGLDELGGEEARVAGAGGQLEHRVPRLGLDRVDHPRRDGHGDPAHHLAVRLPGRRGVAPAGAGLLLVGLAHRSSRRSSFPDALRGSASATSTALGTL